MGSVLDLDAEIRPCPKESLKKNYVATSTSRFRNEVTQQGGQLLFPFLVDDNTGVKLNDSTAIDNYLWATYGNSADPPITYRLAQSMNRMPAIGIPNLFRPLLTHGMLRVP